MRTNVLAVIKWCAIAMVIGGCNQPEAPAPAPPQKPSASHGFRYSKEQVQKFFPDLPSEFKLMADGVEKQDYPAHLFLHPWSDAPSSCKIPAEYQPCDTMMSFNLANRDDPTVPCIFDVIVGKVGEAKGEIVVSDMSDQHVEIGNGIYRAFEGFAVLGGRIPVARGKRSRGGAPGTQFAIYVDKATNVDRYYLIAGSKLTVTSKTASKDITNVGDYVEVKDDGSIIGPTAVPASGDLRNFLDAAKEIAKCGKLLGG